jgi:hypothetical protein
MQTLAPFGLRPAFHPTGLERATPFFNGIVNQYASNVFKGEIVAISASGALGSPPTAGGGNIVVPAANNTTTRILGVFAGVEYTDLTGRRRVSNFWPASNNCIVDQGQNAIIAYVYTDPQIIYITQCDASITNQYGQVGAEYFLSNSTAVSNGAGGTANCQFSAGNTTTGLSTSALGVSTVVGAGSQGNLRIVDIDGDPNNSWADPFPTVRVQLPNLAFYGAFTGI